jgi:GDPmannose 4,6-dehydratase
MKTALIFGCTGQDGAYLSELLLEKGYSVTGVARRVSSPNDQRIRHLLANANFKIIHGDVTDPFSVFRAIEDLGPDEIYNLAAMSHVGVSFGEPSYSMAVTYGGCLNILEVMRETKSAARLYQASSSEMFGTSFSFMEDGELLHLEEGRVAGQDCFQCEETTMRPNSPYAIAKLAAHHACRLYRDAYGVFACSGILFNHESPRRSEQFVTQKICKWLKENREAVRSCKPGVPSLKLGNLQASRDWGHAKDYVRAMWMMLQQSPDDFVIATGVTNTVKEFLHEAFHQAGLLEESVEKYVEIDPSLFRPSEVPYLRGDASKAKKVLGWEPQISFSDLVKDMVGSTNG